MRSSVRRDCLFLWKFWATSWISFDFFPGKKESTRKELIQLFRGTYQSTINKSTFVQYSLCTFYMKQVMKYISQFMVKASNYSDEWLFAHRLQHLHGCWSDVCVCYGQHTAHILYVAILNYSLLYLKRSMNESAYWASGKK